VGAGAGVASLAGARAAIADGIAASRSFAAFNHSVCRWPYRELSVDKLARMARELALDSVELLERDEWPIARKHGLTCAVG
jgi:hydroxypyruvate isomerase